MKHMILLLAFVVPILLLGQGTPQPKPTMGEFIGINADAKEDWHRMEKFSNVREFHSWSSDIGYLAPTNVNPQAFTVSTANYFENPATSELESAVNPDDNGDGTIQLDEIRPFDTNQDGLLTMQDDIEFLQQYLDTDNNGIINNLDADFDNFNTDNSTDNLLSTAELLAFYADKGYLYSPFDTNEDGYTSYSEFLTFDIDNDGVLRNIYRQQGCTNTIEISHVQTTLVSAEDIELSSSYKYRWNPSLDGSRLISYDDFYDKFNQRAIPVYRGIAPHLIGLTKYTDLGLLGDCHERDELKPFVSTNICSQILDFPCPNATPTLLGNYDNFFPSIANQILPATYKEYAKWITMSSLRYGALDNPVAYAPFSEYVSNAFELGYQNSYKNNLKRVGYIEIQNEPEKVWRDGEYALKSQIQYFKTINNNGNPYEQFLTDKDMGKTFYQFKPEQYAALLSASYDGHMGTMTLNGGPLLGVKNLSATNPQQVVMAGLFDLHGAYLEKMMIWSQENRSSASNILPFDVINFHHYSTRYEEQALAFFDDFEFTKDVYDHYAEVKIGRGGLYPERDHFRDNLNTTLFQISDDFFEFTQFDLSNEGLSNGLVDAGVAAVIIIEPAVQAEIKSKEVWISEFGYDTGEDKMVGAGIVEVSSATISYLNDFVQIPDFYNYSTEGNQELSFTARLEIQAQWLTRTYLELSAVESGDLHVQKAMAFELSDKAPRNQGNGAYQHSGLLFLDHTPKPSWYHVLTLKNVLNDYVFDEDVSAVYEVRDDANTVIPIEIGGVPNLRVYRYAHKENGAIGLPDPDLNSTSPNRYIYAIWRPTFDGEVKQDATLVLNGLFANNNLNATIITSENLDEDGRRTIAGSVSQGKITPFTISEQPVFVYTAYNPANKMVSDASIPSVTNIVATPACCGQINLTWNWTNSLTTASAVSFQVYFVPNNIQINSTAELLALATLVTDQARGLSAYIAHPDLEIGTDYRFYVIPVVQQVIAGTSNILLPLWETINANFTIATPVGGNYLAVQIAPADNPNYYNATVPLPNSIQTIESVFNTNNEQICNDVFGAGVLAGVFSADGTLNAPQNKAITVSFGVPTRINSILIDDANGIGRIKVEALYCPPSGVSYLDPERCFELVDIVDLPDFFGTQYVTTKLLKRSVTKLRITPLDDQAGSRKIRFCGVPQPCTSSEPQLMQVPFSEVLFITANSAVVQWPKVLADRRDPQGDDCQLYELQVSTSKNVKGEPVGGIKIDVQGDISQNLVLQTLNTLLPATTYYYLIRPFSNGQNVFNGCVLRLDPTRNPFGPPVTGSFTTKAQAFGTSPKPLLAQPIKQKVVITPNPARDYLMVDFKDGQYNKVELINGLGQILQTDVVAPTSTTYELDVSNVAQGWYVVRVQGTDGSIQNEVVLIAR